MYLYINILDKPVAWFLQSSRCRNLGDYMEFLLCNIIYISFVSVYDTQ